MYLVIKRHLMETSGRAWQCVRRAGQSVAEALARRPRGQQLLRQVDRLLDIAERFARWFAGGDDTNHSTYFPVSVMTLIPLTVLVFPAVVVGVIIISIPLLPLALPILVFGPIVNLCYDGTISTFLSCFPTPSSTATAIRKRRRELRAIRFNGVRDMHLDKVAKSDSILFKIFVWWPVAVMATIGQCIGLGDPYTPASWSPSPLKKRDLEISPRKRKLYELEMVSNAEKQSDTEMEDGDFVDSDSTGVEETPDPLETSIMEMLSRTVQESDATVKDVATADIEDPDYEPEEYITDGTENEDSGDEDEEKGEDGGEKGSAGEVSTLENAHSGKLEDEKSKTETPTQPKKIESAIPEILIDEDGSGLSTPRKDDISAADSPTNNDDYSTPKSGSDDETAGPKDIAQEVSLFLDAETASSSSHIPEEKQIKSPSKDSPSSKYLNDSNYSDEQDSPEGKDGAKSKPLFGGLFRRRSNDKQNDKQT